MRDIYEPKEHEKPVLLKIPTPRRENYRPKGDFQMRILLGTVVFSKADT